MTIGNPSFCLALHLTRVHIRGELQHVGDVSKQKCNSRPIRTRETGCVRLSEARYFFIFFSARFTSSGILTSGQTSMNIHHLDFFG